MEDISHVRDRIRRAWRWLRLDRGTPALVLAALCCFVDYVPNLDAPRNGQIRALLVAAPFAAFFAFRKALTEPLAAFLGYMLLMWTLHDYPNYGMVHLIFFSSACLVANYLSRCSGFDFWLSVLGAFQACFGIAEWWGWNIWDYGAFEAKNKPTGFFAQETMLGAFLVAALAPALFKRRWWAVVPILICCYATGSSFTWGSAGAIVGLWLWDRFGWRVPAAIAAAGAACLGFLIWKNGSYSNVPILQPQGRIGFIRYAYDNYIVQRPIFGWGPGYWWPNAPKVPSPNLPEALPLTHIHNEFVELVVEYGLVGASFLAMSLVQFVRGFRFTWHHALCVGLMVNALGNFPGHIASLGVIFLTAWLLSVRAEAVVVSLRS